MATLAQTQRTVPDRVRDLIGRLEAGWALIDREPDQVRRARLDEHWITVLHEYEAACDEVIAGEPGVSR